MAGGGVFMGAGNERAKAGGGRKYRDERKRKSRGKMGRRDFNFALQILEAFSRSLNSITCSKDREATPKRKKKYLMSTISAKLIKSKEFLQLKYIVLFVPFPSVLFHPDPSHSFVFPGQLKGRDL